MKRLLPYAIVVLCCCCKQNSSDEAGRTLFTKLPDSDTGIQFENKLTNSDFFNIIQYLYFYNGGGVAAGDIDNDGLVDLYFSSNQESNRLYVNKGGFNFEDITEDAGVSGKSEADPAANNWKTGVSMADVNGDGWLDIFVCGVGKYKSFNGRNQLFINNHDRTFTERAEEYGVGFQGFSSQAAFFDYDNDGDLDMYLLNHSVHTVRSYGDVSIRNQSDPLAGDRFFRNELVPSGTARFTDVTTSAGIHSSQVAFGLGVGISDVNNDGYADIYVSNDFHENDYLYLNNGNGSFRQELEKSMAHTSRFSMGNDIADVNEDGWNDVVTMDMFPKSEKVIKTSAGEDNYEIYQYKLRFGYHDQFACNGLQINRGLTADGRLLFSDVAPYAGVAATDWSWAPLLADFDNDGGKDLFITNGIVGRPNDLDYINYISNDSASQKLSDLQLYSRMPSGKVANFFYRKTDGLKFDDVTEKWIGTDASLSNGAAYADIDNDGDLDLLVNNINEKAYVLRNDLPIDSGAFIRIKTEGARKNPFGIGASIKAYGGGNAFFREQFPARGWLSSVDPVLHVGLGNAKSIDSLIVIWPGGAFQKIKDVKTNQLLVVKESDAAGRWNYNRSVKPMLSQIDPISFKHMENDFNVLESQRLIPHMNSTRGPKMSVGDINRDGLEDVFICGGKDQPAVVYLQTRAGKFVAMKQPALEEDAKFEDNCSLLFDADGDKDLDLIVGSGGEEFLDRRILLRYYQNNGRGVFEKTEGNLQKIYSNASSLAAADIDNDKDLDVFVAGGVVTGRYGLGSDSFVLINDGKGMFKESGAAFDQGKRPGGMVHAAVWTDLNNDDTLDLVTAGEWMEVTAWINKKGVLKRQQNNGMDSTFGWWNSLVSADIDNDGDHDIIAGNFGLNTRIQPSDNEPIELIISDIDKNGSHDQILSYYNDGKRYPVASRDQLVKQIPSLKKKYLKYSDYANASIEKIVPEKRAFELKATSLASVCFINMGNGKFEKRNLPEEAQLFPIYAIHASDIDGDGNTDLLLGGNLYAVQPELWRYDAGYGLMLKGDGKGNFNALPMPTSGFNSIGETRDIRSITGADKKKLFLVTRNNDSLLVFKKND